VILRARIYGIARPQGSKRAFRWQARDGRSGVSLVESSGENLKSWRSAVRDAARDARPPQLIEGPVQLTLVFYLKAPKSRKGMPLAPTKRPDLSKLARAIEDELTGVWFHDDSQIVQALLEKRWDLPTPQDVDLNNTATHYQPGVFIECGPYPPGVL